MMRSLVTGGAGFIGSHVVDKLLALGHEVVVLDDLSNGRSSNLVQHEENNNFQFHQLDVSNFDAITSLFDKVDWVFHLAALADIVPSIETPLRYHRSNVDGTAAVMEAARKHEVKRVVYAASSSCYGIPDNYPTPETAPARPMYPYALTKYLGEQIALHWGQVYKIPVVSLRFFNVFGPRARTSGNYGAVFGVFLKQKLAGVPFTVVGDGSQTRDFTYVTDVADAVIASAASDIKNEIFNVGSGGTYSVNELVKELGGEIVYIPKRPGEPDCTFADTGKIRSMLKWTPKISFKDGVANMLDNIKSWEDAPLWTTGDIAVATKSWHKYLGSA